MEETDTTTKKRPSRPKKKTNHVDDKKQESTKESLSSSAFLSRQRESNKAKRLSRSFSVNKISSTSNAEEAPSKKHYFPSLRKAVSKSNLTKDEIPTVKSPEPKRTEVSTKDVVVASPPPTTDNDHPSKPRNNRPVSTEKTKRLTKFGTFSSFRKPWKEEDIFLQH